MQTWNNAQQWFAKKYYPNSRIYTFQESPNGMVKVTFTNNLTRCGKSWGAGCTYLTYGIGRNVTLWIRTSQPAIQGNSEHELGHVLGLDHTTISSDLMYYHPDIYSDNNGLDNTPSTLDLYAVHLLATSSGQVPASVTLPSNIPYLRWITGVNVPEFPSSFLILSATLISLAVGIERRKGSGFSAW
jgi:hypothetical protein